MKERNTSVMLKFFFRFLLLVAASSVALPRLAVHAQEGQGITVTGTIRDASTGEALPGVNIVIAGTYRGADSPLSFRMHQPF
jgi:hypothetical protein